MKTRIDENGNEIRPIDPVLKEGLKTDLSAYGVSPLTKEEEERLDRDDWTVVKEIQERRRREQEAFQRKQGIVSLSDAGDGMGDDVEEEKVSEVMRTEEVSAGKESRQGRKRGPYKKRSAVQAHVHKDLSGEYVNIKVPVEMRSWLQRIVGLYVLAHGKRISMAALIGDFLYSGLKVDAELCEWMKRTGVEENP